MKQSILITGGAGFIGSHLAETFSKNGYRVRVLDNFCSQVHGENNFQFESDNIEVIKGDVRDADDLAKALRGVDVVYHFAASVGVGQSMYEVRHYIENNNVGTATLLQQLIKKPVKKLIVASSMSLYGEGLYQTADGQMLSSVRRDPIRVQKHQWEPLGKNGEELAPVATPETKQPDLASIYALSKYDQERMCLIVGQAYKIPTVALRFFNVYGRGQALSNPYTGVMAIFASRLLNDNPPLIFEDGNQMRDFVHVSDIVQACRLALEKKEADGLCFNVGSGSHYKIKDIALKMARVLGKQIEPEITNQYRVGDIRHCFADISLASKVLGYKPQMSLNEGLQDLTAWLKDQNAVDRVNEAREELKRRGLAL